MNGVPRPTSGCDARRASPRAVQSILAWRRRVNSEMLFRSTNRQLLSLVLPLTIASIVASAGQVAINVKAKLENLSLQAREAQQRGDYRSAARSYREILNLRSDLAEVRANLGLMQHLLAEYHEAIRTFENPIPQ